MNRAPFKRHRGIVAPLLLSNVNTDAIIPSREMTRVSRKGMSKGLFAGWRYLAGPERTPNPEFVLNHDEFSGASILVSGSNFGCGSSREHAVWALAEFGFRVIIAPSFASIFERNCVNNGVLPLVLRPEEIQQIVDACAKDPQQLQLEVDLEAQSVTVPDGTVHFFAFDSLQKEVMVNGWDPIDQTLLHAAEIDAFERQDKQDRDWAYGMF